MIILSRILSTHTTVSFSLSVMLFLSCFLCDDIKMDRVPFMEVSKIAKIGQSGSSTLFECKRPPQKRRLMHSRMIHLHFSFKKLLWSVKPFASQKCKLGGLFSRPYFPGHLVETYKRTKVERKIEAHDFLYHDEDSDQPDPHFKHVLVKGIYKQHFPRLVCFSSAYFSCVFLTARFHCSILRVSVVYFSRNNVWSRRFASHD